MTVRFGLGCPVFPVEEALQAARFADAAGFDGLWIPEYLIRRGDRGQALDPLVLLGAAARETQRVQLGTYVLGIHRRHPSLLALMAASLDHLCGGRLILGLGTGATEMDRALGIAYDRGVARLGEYIEVLRHLWQGEQVQYAGEYYQLRGATLSLQPLQQPLPIWLAAQGPVAMQVAGALADGWISNWLYTPEGFGRALSTVRARARAAGRSPEALVGVFEAAVSVAGTRAEAEAHGVPAVKAKLLKIGGLYEYGYRQLQALGYDGPRPEALEQIPDEAARACSILGMPPEVIERIEAYIKQGVDYFICTFMNPGGAELFARVVLPHFRASPGR